MTKNWILNGELHAELSPFDRGLAYGDGVFTTMAWRNNCIEFLSLHIQRLLRDAQQLNIHFCEKKTREDLDKLKNYLVGQRISYGVFKIIITRGTGERGYKYTQAVKPTILISHQNISAHLSERIGEEVNMSVCEHRLHADPFPGVKHLNRLQQVVARSEWNDKCADVVIHEGVLLNVNDRVVEAVAANIFWINKGVLYTPVLDEQGINGVMRECVLEQVKSLALEVRVGEFTLEDILAAQELFITNSLLQVCHVNNLYQFKGKLAHEKASVKSHKAFTQNSWTLKIKKLVERSSQHSERI